MLSFRTCAGAMHMRAFAQAQARTAHMRTGKLAPVRPPARLPWIELHADVCVCWPWFITIKALSGLLGQASKVYD